jgi:hypothetical protein
MDEDSFHVTGEAAPLALTHVPEFLRDLNDIDVLYASLVECLRCRVQPRVIVAAIFFVVGDWPFDHALMI